MIPRPSPAATRSSPVASAILALCAVGAMGAAVTEPPSPPRCALRWIASDMTSPPRGPSLES